MHAQHQLFVVREQGRRVGIKRRDVPVRAQFRQHEVEGLGQDARVVLRGEFAVGQLGFDALELVQVDARILQELVDRFAEV